MAPVYLATALHTAIHACFTGSKVILSLLALELGSSPALVGALIACYSLAPLALGVYSGRLADTIGMRIPMIFGAVFMALAMLVGAQWQTLAALFAVALLVGAGFVFFIVSVQNLVGVMPGNRARNYSILTVGYSVSNFIGPLIAGYAIEYGGHATAFLVFSAFTLVPLCVLALNPALTRVAAPKPPDGGRNALELLRLPPLRQQIIITGLSMAAWELFVFYLPIYGHGIGLAPSLIGIVLSVFAVATFLVRFVLSWIIAKAPVEHVLAASMLLAACVCAIFPLLTEPYALISASFVLGLGLGCSQPLSLTLSFERSPPGRSGEVAGLRLIATNLARFVVPLASGAFGSTLGVGAVFWMNAVNLSAISWLAKRS
ncbi:MAG TPA: MFS transporter [Burkholderiales bacterium]|nr:MFS transporter [Burkholderiales bacterium]